MCCKLTLRPFFVCRTLPPPPPRVSRPHLYRLCLVYIHISDIGDLLIHGRGTKIVLCLPCIMIYIKEWAHTFYFSKIKGFVFGNASEIFGSAAQSFCCLLPLCHTSFYNWSISIINSEMYIIYTKQKETIPNFHL